MNSISLNPCKMPDLGSARRHGFSILNLQLDLVRVPTQLGGVHRGGLGGERVIAAGDLGPHPVGDAVLAAGELPDEEADAIVAEFHVGPQRVAAVAAADLDRLKTGGL